MSAWTFIGYFCAFAVRNSHMLARFASVAESINTKEHLISFLCACGRVEFGLNLQCIVSYYNFIVFVDYFYGFYVIFMYKVYIYSC